MKCLFKKRFGEQLSMSNLEMKYSKGWIHFKKRHYIREMTICGESRSVNKIDASKKRENFQKVHWCIIHTLKRHG